MYLLFGPFRTKSFKTNVTFYLIFFSSQVALFQLNDVTLMVSIYAKRNMKRNEMVGWFSLGLNSSGPEEMAHWQDMRETTRGELLARWHILVDS